MASVSMLLNILKEDAIFQGEVVKRRDVHLDQYLADHLLKVVLCPPLPRTLEPLDSRSKHKPEEKQT